jgi:tRNA G18 (ribose-2'-O)-methylase SpoU
MKISSPGAVLSNTERNILPCYKSLETGEIKNLLRENSLPGSVLMSQIEGDFNFSSVIRNANFFNLKSVYYYGRRRYDRRGAVGTHNYKDVLFLDSIDEIKKLKEQYVFIGLENNVQTTGYIDEFKWPSNSLIIIGEEHSGITKEILELCDSVLEIRTRGTIPGSVPSLNAATAAGIAIHDYVSKL